MSRLPRAVITSAFGNPQTNLSNFTGTTYRNVSRSYYEFQQFYEAVIQNNPQTIVPALPLARTQHHARQPGATRQQGGKPAGPPSTRRGCRRG